MLSTLSGFVIMTCIGKSRLHVYYKVGEINISDGGGVKEIIGTCGGGERNLGTSNGGGDKIILPYFSKSLPPSENNYVPLIVPSNHNT